METKRRSRWHEFYNKTETEVISVLQEKLWSLNLPGFRASESAGLHRGFWNKFKNGETSPSRKSLFCFCKALDLPVEYICSLYRRGYKPTHREITKWETQGGAHTCKKAHSTQEPTQSELNVFENVEKIQTPEQYDLHCINWLKSRGFKIQKVITVTTLEEI
jgi:hypothetical protein